MPENDEFTLSLLTNSEYMHMHKTVRNSRQLARRETDNKGYIIWDGENEDSRYLALFNTDDKEITINTKDTVYIDTVGAYNIWLKDISKSNEYTIAPHGAVLLKINK